MLTAASAPECRHIFTSGARCHCAARRGEPFCPHHANRRELVQANRARKRSVILPPLEDHAAVQMSIDEVLAALSARKISRREAGTYLYGIQLATRNLTQVLANAPAPGPAVLDLEITEDGDILAASEPSNVGAPGSGSPQTGLGLWDGDSSLLGTGEDSKSSESLGDPEEPVGAPGSSHLGTGEDSESAQTLADIEDLPAAEEVRNTRAVHTYEDETAPPLTKTAIKERLRMIDMHLKRYYSSRAYYRGLPANHPDDPPFVLNWIQQHIDSLEAELKALNESAKPDPVPSP